MRAKFVKSAGDGRNDPVDLRINLLHMAAFFEK
jgi:hypothetical protein